MKLKHTPESGHGTHWCMSEDNIDLAVMSLRTSKMGQLV